MLYALHVFIHGLWMLCVLFPFGSVTNNAVMNIQQTSRGHMFSFPLAYMQEWNLLSSKMKNKTKTNTLESK